MKRFSIALLACFVLAVSLAGCSGPAKSSDAESLKGFWEVDSSTLGFEAALNLDEENFAELVMGDSYFEGTWTADGSKATVTFEDAEPVSVYVSDGKLVYGSDEGSRLVFAKSDPEQFGNDDVATIASGASAGAVGTLDGTEVGELDDFEVVDEVIEDIKPVSVVDDEICKIEVTGKGTDFTGDPGYRLSITNNYDKAISIIAEDMFKVGDKQIEAGLGEIAEAGETIEAFMYFSADEVGGLDKLTKVEGKIVVADDDSSKDLKTYDFKMD